MPSTPWPKSWLRLPRRAKRMNRRLHMRDRREVNNAMSLLTLPAPAPTNPSPGYEVPGVPIFRLSLDQYHHMVQTGILTEDEPVEFLKGWLVVKMSKNPPHRTATGLTRDALTRLLPPGFFLESQDPFTTPDSEPEPDVGVVRGERRQFNDHHPGPGDLALVIEIADTSLR